MTVIAHKLNEIFAKLLNPADFPEFSDHKHSPEFLPYAIAYSDKLISQYSNNNQETRPLNGRKELDTLFTLPYWTKVKPCYGLNWRTGENYIAHRHYALFWFVKLDTNNFVACIYPCECLAYL